MPGCPKIFDDYYDNNNLNNILNDNDKAMTITMILILIWMQMIRIQMT